MVIEVGPLLDTIDPVAVTGPLLVETDPVAVIGPLLDETDPVGVLEAKTVVKLLVPPVVVAVPVTTLNALLSNPASIFLVHPVGAAVCWNNITVPVGNVARSVIFAPLPEKLVAVTIPAFTIFLLLSIIVDPAI
jgi:hypothetical protein